MKDRGPNWGLAFGSASFLIVWCLGFLSNVAVETIALRSCVGTILGAVIGMLVGQTLEGLRTLRTETAKGSKVDFTVPAAADELTATDAPAAGATTTSTAPGASPAATSASTTVPEAPAAVGPDFKPIDFKSAARQIQATMKE